MPLLDPSVRVQKSADLTKSLRDRSASVVSFLGTARSLFSEEHCINFPRRNDWLLEWLAQRMKEDDEPETRASPQTWRFLLELVECVKDPIIVARILRRHPIVLTLARAMAEMRRETQGDVTLPVAVDQGDVLTSITAVLFRLQALSKRESSVAVATKTSIEVGAALLGDFFEVIRMLHAQSLSVRDEQVESVLDIWRRSVWGNSNMKKISTVWSERCLKAASRLLTVSNLSSTLKSTLEGMISEYIFSPDVVTAAGGASNLISASTELRLLLMPLRSKDTNNSGDTCRSSGMFSIALSAQRKRQTSKPDPGAVEIILYSLLDVIDEVDLLATEAVSEKASDSITALLQVLVNTESNLPVPTLVKMVSSAANLKHRRPNPRWSVVEFALRNDFDAFLHPEQAALMATIFDLISFSPSSPEIHRILGLLVKGFANARNLLEFLEHWKSGLAVSPDGVWSEDDLAATFATHVEATLIPGQIEKLVAALANEKQWVILDAVLRGVQRAETEEKLADSAALEDITVSAEQEMGWEAWRVFVRVADINPSLAPKMVKSAKNIVAAADADPKEIFAAEIILIASHRAADRSGLDEVHKVFERISTMWLDVTATHKNFVISLTAAVVARYLELFEVVDAEHRNSWVDSLLMAALRGDFDTGALWRTMLGDPEFYECAALKDSVLNTLQAKLVPNCGDVRDIATTLTKPNKAPIKDQTVKFLVDSLMQFPSESMRRTSRHIILENLFTLDALGYTGVRQLIDKLWTAGGTSSSLATSAKYLNSYFQRPGADLTGKSILRHIIANKNQPKAKEFILEILKTIKGPISKGAASKQDLLLGWGFATELWSCRHDPGFQIADQLESIRKDLLRILSSVIRDNPQLDAQYLEIWRDLLSLDRQGQDREEVISLVRHLAGLLLERSETQHINDGWIEGVAVVCWSAEDLDDAIRATALTVYALERIDLNDHSKIIGEYCRMIKRLEVHVHTALLEHVCLACIAGGLNQVAWALLQGLVETIRRPLMYDSLTITRLNFDLALYLPHAVSSAAYISVADSLSILFESHKWSATQYTVDSALAALTFVCAPTCLIPPGSVSSDEIYMSSVRLFVKIISLHRQRIRGRYHLVVNLLQRLMTCLFNPRIIRRKTDAELHPPWITSSLGVKAAGTFCRAIQVFCDPAVSSVRSHKSELIESERTKERRRVGAVVGPVLECWVQRTLEENMEVDVRKEVRGAVEKVVQVLGKDGVARVSGSVSAEGRAVIRGLWKESGARPRERV